jgi:hypothetical protein
MKKRNATKSKAYRKVSSGRLNIKLAQPGKRLSELVSVYEDLERTLRRLKTSALQTSGNSLMQINVRKLIVQLSKSKRKIERKISSTLLSERAQIVHKLDQWTPRLGSKISKKRTQSRTHSESVQ